MEKPLRLKLKKLYHLTRPAHVVNICFIVVLFFSTLLIWREINVLEEAYVANQRNNLANVAHEMDGLLQFNIDRMMFFATVCSPRLNARSTSMCCTKPASAI